MGREFWYHRNWRVFKGVFKSGGCFPPHMSVFLLIGFGYFLLVLIRVCLGFFTLMDYVDSCEIRNDFTCKMWSEIDVFDVKCEIDDIPYQYLRFFVRIVICIVGKLRPSSDVVLLPCRAELQFGSTVARQEINSDSDVVPESNQIPGPGFTEAS